MKTGREIGFVVSLLLAGLCLHFLQYDERKVALQRVDTVLRRDAGLREVVTQHCSRLSSREDSVVEKFFRERLSPSEPRGSVSCEILVESSRSHRFYLQSQWHFVARVVSETPAIILQKSLLVETPRPLCLLPLAALILALVFEMRFWGLAGTVASYMLLLSGGNAIRAVELSARSSWLALQTEQHFMGFLFILLWLSIYRTRKLEPVSRSEQGLIEGLASRALCFVTGLWNPVVYTLGGRLIFPFRTGLPRLNSFLDAQFFVLCLSLYLLTLDWKNPKDLVEKSFLLPRYFSFTALLFFAIAYWSTSSRRQTVAWRLPHFWRVIGAILLTELVAWRTPYLRGLPTLLRVGLAALVSELIGPVGIEWKQAVRLFVPSLCVLFTGSFVATASQESGIRELVMTVLDPRLHPTGFVLFTFFSGIGLGFLTGNFSAAFFPLLTSLGKSSDLVLVRAAMLDGILAGVMLSPFSLFNLFPAVQFETSLPQLIAFRFRQILFPLLIGSVIYAVSSITSVAILQPVTFVFLCLVALTFQLQKSAWRFRRVLPV